MRNYRRDSAFVEHEVLRQRRGRWPTAEGKAVGSSNYLSKAWTQTQKPCSKAHRLDLLV